MLEGKTRILEVCSKVIQKNGKKPTEKDIIVKRYRKQVEYNSKGEKTTKRIPEQINITKRINETKKLVKQDKARELLEEINKIYTKE